MAVDLAKDNQQRSYKLLIKGKDDPAVYTTLSAWEFPVYAHIRVGRGFTLLGEPIFYLDGCLFFPSFQVKL
jgi:hypothetical protein